MNPADPASNLKFVFNPVRLVKWRSRAGEAAQDRRGAPRACPWPWPAARHTQPHSVRRCCCRHTCAAAGEWPWRHRAQWHFWCVWLGGGGWRGVSGGCADGWRGVNVWWWWWVVVVGGGPGKPGSQGRTIILEASRLRRHSAASSAGDHWHCSPSAFRRAGRGWAAHPGRLGCNSPPCPPTHPALARCRRRLRVQAVYRPPGHLHPQEVQRRRPPHPPQRRRDSLRAVGWAGRGGAGRGGAGW